MLKSTPIIVVEDDKDDQDLMQTILKDLKVSSPVLFFSLCEDAFRYLKTTSDVPFIIFCDINLPKQDGLQFKEQVDKDKQLRKKSIPFVFYSTSTNQKSIDKAYSTLNIQGFFEKPNSYGEAKQLVKLVLEYWYHCKHPNSFKLGK